MRPRKLFLYSDEFALADARLAKHRMKRIDPHGEIVDKKLLMMESKAAKALCDANSSKL